MCSRSVARTGPSCITWLTSLSHRLIPSELRFEVDERIDHTGQVLVPLDPAQVDTLISLFQQQQVESVAVCLLFSFLASRPRTAHRRAAARRLAFSFLPPAKSSLNIREYERTSTTVINAYVSPILDRYLSRLEQALFLPSPVSGEELAERESRCDFPAHHAVQRRC